MDALSFSSEIAQWADEAKNWASSECAKKARYVLVKIVEFSPDKVIGSRYSKGHFQRNWIISGSPVLPREYEGEVTQAAKIAEINEAIDDKFFLQHKAAYFTNGTHYSREVEYVGWKKRDGSPGHPAYSPVAKGIAASME